MNSSHTAEGLGLRSRTGLLHLPSIEPVPVALPKKTSRELLSRVPDFSPAQSLPNCSAPSEAVDISVWVTLTPQVPEHCLCQLSTAAHVAAVCTMSLGASSNAEAGFMAQRMGWKVLDQLTTPKWSLASAHQSSISCEAKLNGWPNSDCA